MSNFSEQQDKASELLNWYNPFGALLFTYVKNSIMHIMVKYSIHSPSLTSLLASTWLEYLLSIIFLYIHF